MIIINNNGDHRNHRNNSKITNTYVIYIYMYTILIDATLKTIFSDTLVNGSKTCSTLNDIPNRQPNKNPWARVFDSAQITPTRLARMLRSFEIWKSDQEP